VLARAGLQLSGFQMPSYLADFLTYGCVVDCSALEREFGWRPAHTTRETLAAFASAQEYGFEPPYEGPQEYELSMYLQRRRQAGLPLRVVK
jgi:hypothetical protein